MCVCVCLRVYVKKEKEKKVYTTPEQEHTAFKCLEIIFPTIILIILMML